MDIASDAATCVMHLDPGSLARAIAFIEKMPLPDNRKPQQVLWRLKFSDYANTHRGHWMLGMTGYSTAYPSEPCYEVELAIEQGALPAPFGLVDVAFMSNLDVWQSLAHEINLRPSPTWGVRLSADLRAPTPGEVTTWTLTTPTLTLKASAFVGEWMYYPTRFKRVYDPAMGPQTRVATWPTADILPLARMLPVADSDYRIELRGVNVTCNGEGLYCYHAVDGVQLHTVERLYGGVQEDRSVQYESTITLPAVHALRVAEQVYGLDYLWQFSLNAGPGQGWMRYGPVVVFNQFTGYPFPRNVAERPVLTARSRSQDVNPFHRRPGEAWVGTLEIKPLIALLEIFKPHCKASNWVLLMRPRGENALDMGYLEGGVENRAEVWLEAPVGEGKLINPQMEYKRYALNYRYLADGLGILKKAGHQRVKATLRLPKEVTTWEAEREHKEFRELELHSIMPFTDAEAAVRYGTTGKKGGGK